MSKILLNYSIYKSLNSQSCLFSYLLKQEKLFNSKYILDNSYLSEKIMIDRLYNNLSLFLNKTKRNSSVGYRVFSILKFELTPILQFFFKSDNIVCLTRIRMGMCSKTTLKLKDEKILNYFNSF